MPSSTSSHQQVSSKQQQTTFHTGINEVNDSNYSSSLHQKAQQHKQQLQQQQQLVDQLSKEHTETLSQLNKAKSAIAKQNVEISSLKAQISKYTKVTLDGGSDLLQIISISSLFKPFFISEQNQIQMKQNIQALQEEKELNSGLQEKLACFESTVNGLRRF